MTTITAAEIATLRRKIGDNGNPPAFQVYELDENWVEAGEDMNTAVLICLEDLASNSFKFTDYTQNETQEKRAQIFKHLVDDLIPYWSKKVAADNTAAYIPRIVGTKVQPPRRMEKPYSEDSSG